MNRWAVEGTRALLHQSGFPERWWPLAIRHWAMCYNGLYTGTDGFTPWERRFKQKAPHTLYPFGALVMYCPPTKTTPAAKSDNKQSNK